MSMHNSPIYKLIFINGVKLYFEPAGDLTPRLRHFIHWHRNKYQLIYRPYKILAIAYVYSNSVCFLSSEITYR